MEICARCGEETSVHTMSMFNTDVICMKCKEKEKAHPRYERARIAERVAVQNGDYNYQGIGLPSDLR